MCYGFDFNVFVSDTSDISNLHIILNIFYEYINIIIFLIIAILCSFLSNMYINLLPKYVYKLYGNKLFKYLYETFLYNTADCG